MPDLQIIRRRMRAIESTRKMTRAMEMVAAAKLRRAQEQAQAGRAYAARLQEVLRRLAASGVQVEHPLLAPPRGSDRLLVVFTADRGLAGPFNANIIRETALAMREGEPAQIAVLGRRGDGAFRHRGWPVRHSWLGIGEEARVELAREVADLAMEWYIQGQVGRVELIYTEFVSTLRLVPRRLQLLPVVTPEAQEGGRRQATVDYIFVPSAEGLLVHLLPSMVRTTVYQALLDSKASEHAARMTAMRSATDNASELLEELHLEYNRERQTSITTEIVEVVSGAEALRG
ncbi:MAG: ATP synthase F1 subunit gamma [Clostridia bacterium]|nr:ATP synthase F1 subunit gamma [Clostridia bacterium]MCL6521078.1 ATP synthase F1 subunit gamma [Bacillota bacterium]